MSDLISFSIRDLVPHPDLIQIGAEPDLRLHHVAQAQLHRKYKSFRSEASLSARLQVDGRDVEIHGRLDGWRRTSKGIVLYEIKAVRGNPGNLLGSPLLQNARRQLRLYVDLSDTARDLPWGRGEVTSALLCLVSESKRIAVETIDLRDTDGLLGRRLRAVLKCASALTSGVG